MSKKKAIGRPKKQSATPSQAKALKHAQAKVNFLEFKLDAAKADRAAVLRSAVSLGGSEVGRILGMSAGQARRLLNNALRTAHPGGNQS